MADPTPLDVLYIPQGATFMHAWPLTDADTGLTADLTGWTARCEVRIDYGGSLITRFHTTLPWDGDITFDDAANLILTLDATFTTALTPIQNAVFDVEMIDPSGKPWRVLRGRAHVTPEVTTDA